MNDLPNGYWCECWTQNPDRDQRLALHASFDAYSAVQADRWIAVALLTISPALDAAASEQAWQWLYEGRIETRRTRRHLRAPGPCRALAASAVKITVRLSEHGDRESM
ncbi:hypothetical protein BN159_0616 [Streptomyces davaonensis JCM 4913]|uniref:Uncharacterized protein n=1 Tax=Streptomyces davaonensis (strain DSM 101723 / JCM 4913 / KCC S-0913 / 768) TaxID=1214101 RepID=K4QW00_STRDJ|nr:hypothetical protein [Streptomyces davaonensis]CCK24995.1 hypothetical protein BN159_0616 [Streptomyces davaonensis JCM 4913]